MRFVTFHPHAASELAEAVEYYEARSEGLGSEFLNEIQRSLKQVMANPEAYQSIGRRARRKPLWRFPYSLVYAIYPDRIRVVAVAHFKRRPYYWRRRMQDEG